MYNLLAFDPRELSKLIQISQKNSAKLNHVLNNQERLETMMNEQKTQISEIMLRLDERHENPKMKAKGKGTKAGEFYQVNINYFLLMPFFYAISTYNYLYYRIRLKN